MVEFNNITKSVIEGDTSKAVELTRAALEGGIIPQEILNKGLIPGINKVGELFSAGEYFLPELLIAGEAMIAAVEQLKPIMRRSGVSPVGKYLIGTVQGDVHDIGKNIVVMMLEGNGWEVTDLGMDVTPEQFCKAIEEGDYDIVGLSALLTSTMTMQAETIRALEASGLHDRVKVMIGGAPVTQDYADEIGASSYARNAAEAVKKAAFLMERG